MTTDDRELADFLNEDIERLEAEIAALKDERDRLATQLIEAEKYNAWHQQAVTERDRITARYVAAKIAIEEKNLRLSEAYIEQDRLRADFNDCNFTRETLKQQVIRLRSALGEILHAIEAIPGDGWSDGERCKQLARRALRVSYT